LFNVKKQVAEKSALNLALDATQSKPLNHIAGSEAPFTAKIQHDYLEAAVETWGPNQKPDLHRDERILVVDLDGTLVRSDMLFETFWACFSQTWTAPLLAISSLAGGRAALKRRLCTMASVEAARLPYNSEVIPYLERWRATGGRIALVTASDQMLADAVAAHLGLFDEVHGSDGRRYLKGEAKAQFLSDRFGEGCFDYVGNSAADLPVWSKAAKAITVNAPPQLRAKVDGLTRKAEHLTGSAPEIKPYIKALRPHQWLKNTLVFVPMIAAHAFSPEKFWQTVLAFVAFSLVASCVYVLNDLLDLAADRAHPRKRLRPFASGDLPIAHGTWMAPTLLLLGLACAAALGWLVLLTVLGYFVATSAYSLDLKRRMVIDICMLAGLYTTRILAGGMATGIPLSVWLLAFSIFFFFSLATVKRYAELVDGIASGRITVHGRGYHVNDLPLIGAMALASGYVSVLIMALYLNSPAVAKLYSNPSALWGICLVLLYWISRMAIVTHRGAMHDDPIIYAIKDRSSQFCLVLIAGFGIAGAVL
jgi:4-hydroxybenzoate polyprenyltransferase/phosphoserine phosphatase